MDFVKDEEANEDEDKKSHTDAEVPAMCYEKTDPYNYEWTEAAFNAICDGALHQALFMFGSVGRAHAFGTCPRCGHYFEWSMLTEGVNGLGGVLDQHIAEFQAHHLPQTVELDVSCGCDVDHPGGPKGSRGCGIAFRIQFRERVHG